ncbi:MAG: cAMP-activated global transcriptional regulator CRP [Pseudomonadota bacterium]
MQPGQPEGPLAHFLQHTHRKTYRAQTIIINEGDVCDTLYYVVEGSVRVVQEDTDGREIVLAYLNTGDFFGEMGLFSDDEHRSAKVVARSDCSIAEMTYEQFRQIAQSDPELVFSLASQLSSRLRKTTQKVVDLAFLDVTGRIAHTLLDLAREPDAMTHPDGMQIRITRQELAKIVGCSREMAGRVLKELEDDGLITAHGKTIVVFGTR